MKKYIDIFLVILYFFFIFFVTSVSIYNVINKITFFSMFATIIITIVIFLVIYKFIYKKLDIIKFKKINEVKDDKRIFYILFLLSFSFMLFCLLAYFPGAVNPDNNDQFLQALGHNGLHDWHPIIHTLIFLRIPVLFVKHYAFVIFVELFLYSFSISYLFYKLYKYNFNFKLLITLFILLVLNPYIFRYLMFANKDNVVLYLLNFLFAYLVEIYHDKKWLSKTMNLFIMSIVIILVYAVRRNTILFILPFIIIVYFFMDKNIRKKFTILLIALYVSVTLFSNLYPHEKIYQYKLEMLGNPLTIWGNVVSHNKDKLSDKDKLEFYRILPEEIYDIEANEYIYGGLFKYHSSFDREYVDNMSLGKIFYLTIRALMISPLDAYKSLSKLYNLVLGINGLNYPIELYMNPECYYSYQNNNETLMIYTDFIVSVISSNFITRILFGDASFYNFILVTLFVYFFIRNRKSCIYFIPILFLNFGTMFVLAEYDPRYFLATLICYIPIIFIAFKDDKLFIKR